MSMVSGRRPAHSGGSPASRAGADRAIHVVLQVRVSPTRGRLRPRRAGSALSSACRGRGPAPGAVQWGVFRQLGVRKIGARSGRRLPVAIAPGVEHLSVTDRLGDAAKIPAGPGIHVLLRQMNSKKLTMNSGDRRLLTSTDSACDTRPGRFEMADPHHQRKPDTTSGRWPKAESSAPSNAATMTSRPALELDRRSAR